MPEVKVKRSQVAAFLNTGTLAVPIWSRMGKGIAGQSIAYNPQATTETYIDADSASTSLDSYQVQISSPQTAYAGNPVFDYVDNIRRTRAIGAAAETEVLLVYLYSGSPYKSERNNAVIQVNSFGGDGGKPVTIDYAIGLNGDPVIGTSLVTDGAPVFTPDTVTAIALSTIVPADAATGIAVGAAIVITFNNAIKAEDVTLILSTTGAVKPCTKSLDATKKILTLSPTTAMTAATKHFVIVGGVVDAYGQILANVTKSFTTA